MSGPSRTSWKTILLVIAAVSFGLWGHGPLSSNSHHQVDSHRELNALLYMQMSAEYHACCLQAFQLALFRLKEKRQTHTPMDGKPWAVVTDLDETIFDNSAFNAAMMQQKLIFQPKIWEFFEAECGDDVRLVPGALAFAQEAARLDVRMVYISNRSNKNRASTLATLQRLGLPIEDADRQLLLHEGASDKSERCRRAEQMFQVLLYLGDNLRDFDDAYAFPKGIDQAPMEEKQKAIEERARLVQRHGAHWGQDWIVFPNPLYGEWDKPTLRDPGRILRSTSKPLPSS